ncbi:MAG: protein translocase subunit SecF [Dehalococcoidia bacterium]
MDLVGKRRWFFILSAIIIVPGLISLVIPPSLHLGIEFTGGSTLNIEFTDTVTEAELNAVLVRQGHPEAVIQATGRTGFFIRISRLREAEAQVDARSEREVLEEAFGNLAPLAREVEVESVSGVVASGTVRNSFVAVVAASIAILLYITWAFRHVPRPFRYGVAAIVALVHDVLIVVGIFSILGKLVNLEVNAMFITGLLTVIGYSVHDTIVVFDRIRENVIRLPAERFERAVNTSLLETMGRSVNTSLTILFTLLALLLLGGESIRNFLLVLLIGIIAGTYSSICIASQVLVVWETGEAGRFLRRLHLLPSRTQA